MSSIETTGLTAYCGENPYIFVSYSHRDSQVVFPLIRALQTAGYRIWFDQGIEAGTEWSNNIAARLRNCSAFLFFTSHNSVASENCLDEVAYAKAHKKPALLVFLEENVTLPEGTEMQTARFQRMFLSRQENVSEFVKNFSGSSLFDVCRQETSPVDVPAPAPAVPVTPVSAVPAPTAQKAVNKGLLWGALAAVAVLAVVAVLLLKPPASPAQGDPSSPQNEENEIVTLSDSLSDHTFRLEGTVYRLPVKYTALVNRGWTINSSSYNPDLYMAGHSKETLYMVKDGKKISVSVYNDEENAKKIRDCWIGEIEVGNNGNVDFCIAAEMAPGATADELVEAFGTPTTRNEHTDYVSLKWETSEREELQAFCYTDPTSPYNSLSISYYVLSDKEAPVRNTAPAYLDSYVAPSSLGSDLYSAAFSLNGKVYQLPVPFRELTKNGWEIASGAGTLIAGAKTDLEITCNGKKLTVEVINLSPYKTTPEHCLVTKVYTYGDQAADLALPGQITQGLAAADLAKRVPDTMEKNESTYTTSYSYGDYKERDFYLHLSVDKETGKLNSIALSNRVSGIIVEE